MKRKKKVLKFIIIYLFYINVQLDHVFKDNICMRHF